jgi:hypothetical protein
MNQYDKILNIDNLSNILLLLFFLVRDLVDCSTCTLEIIKIVLLIDYHIIIFTF